MAHTEHRNCVNMHSTSKVVIGNNRKESYGYAIISFRDKVGMGREDTCLQKYFIKKIYWLSQQ